MMAALLSTVPAGAQPPIPVPSSTEIGAPIVSPEQAARTLAASGGNNFKVPIKSGVDPENIRLAVQNGRVSMVVRQAELKDVLAALAESQGLNIICADDVSASVSITLRDVPIEDALSAIVSISGCTWTQVGSIIQVTSISESQKLAPAVQGRRIRIFTLDYVTGDDLLGSLKTMLSPVGNAYVSAMSADNNRKTAESIVVEDLPEYLARIEQYIDQMDQPPRQVVIEVHVLQVQLQEDCRHGVDFDHLMHIGGHTFELDVTGFAAASSPQAFFAKLSANNLNGLIEAIKRTTDAKTLASPRVLALNGQLSRIQVGEKLGYRVLTNTQTSTLEDIKFMDVGVVLEVTPTISRDQRVLLDINPKVSTGQVDADTGLPNEATSEVETNVLLQDGQGIVIGGLIQEEITDDQSKLIGLGDLYVVGALFQRRKVLKTRKEIIFFLLPKIVSCAPCLEGNDAVDAERAQTRLFCGALEPNERPWEPRLPNCYDNPKKIHMPKLRLPSLHPHAQCTGSCPEPAREQDDAVRYELRDDAPVPPPSLDDIPTPKTTARQISYERAVQLGTDTVRRHYRPAPVANRRIQLQYPNSMRRR